MDRKNLTRDALSDEFRYPERILTLELENRNLESISLNALSIFTNVNTIYLGSNSLITINSQIFQNLDLKRLLINLNSITVLNINFSEHLMGLISLDLSDNSLMYLSPENFAHFSLLKSLNLAGNQLMEVDYNLFHPLKSLTSLSLMNNCLTRLDPKSISVLIELQELDLSMNKLHVLDFSMFQHLRKLRLLKLNGNGLKSLDHGLSSLVSLEEFEVWYVCLFWVNIIWFFHYCFFLVQVQSNKITLLRPDAFTSLYNLKKLFINDNLITEIDPLTFYGLKNLTNLSLSRNRISRLEPKTLCTLSHLEDLDVSLNLIDKIEPEVYQNLPSLEFLYVTSPNNNQIEFVNIKKEPKSRRNNQSKTKSQDDDEDDLQKQKANNQGVRSSCCIIQ